MILIKKFFLNILKNIFQVQTHGYVAIGFSPNGGMKGSDIILARIQNEEIILQDMFAPTNNEQPKLDIQQDIKLIHGYQNDTHTVVAFERFVYEFFDDFYCLHYGPNHFLLYT